MRGPVIWMVRSLHPLVLRHDCILDFVDTLIGLNLLHFCQILFVLMRFGAIVAR